MNSLRMGMWIKKTLVCLKKALVRPFSDCSQIKSIAFASHPNCYYESGFCYLLVDGKNGAKFVSALLKTYEVKDFASFTSMAAVNETAKLCGSDFMRKFLLAVKDHFQKKYEKLSFLEESE